MADTIFIIGEVDYSAHVVAESYSVQTYDIYNSWTDGNGTEHRERYRTRLQGEFEMYFNDIDTFDAFNTIVRQNKSLDLSVAVTLRDNLTNELVNASVFLDYEPERYRKPDWDDAVAKFKVKVSER